MQSRIIFIAENQHFLPHFYVDTFVTENAVVIKLIHKYTNEIKRARNPLCQFDMNRFDGRIYLIGCSCTLSVIFQIAGKHLQEIVQSII